MHYAHVCCSPLLVRFWCGGGAKIVQKIELPKTAKLTCQILTFEKLTLLTLFNAYIYVRAAHKYSARSAQK